MRLAGEDVRDVIVPDAVNVALQLRGKAAVEVIGDGFDVRDEGLRGLPGRTVAGVNDRRLRLRRFRTRLHVLTVHHHRNVRAVFESDADRVAREEHRDAILALVVRKIDTGDLKLQEI